MRYLPLYKFRSRTNFHSVTFSGGEVAARKYRFPFGCLPAPLDYGTQWVLAFDKNWKETTVISGQTWTVAIVAYRALSLCPVKKYPQVLTETNVSHSASSEGDKRNMIRSAGPAYRKVASEVATVGLSYLYGSHSALLYSLSHQLTFSYLSTFYLKFQSITRFF